MSTEGLIGVAALVIISLISIGLPFLRRSFSQEKDIQEQKERDELLTTYERVLATIRDLDEDYRTGKLAEETYQTERTYWTEQGITLLQRLEPDLESSTQESVPVTHDEPSGSKVDSDNDAIEEAIQAYRRARSRA